MKHLLTLLFLIGGIGHILGKQNVSFNINQFKIDKNVFCVYETMTSYTMSNSSTEYEVVIQDSSIIQSQESLIFKSPIWVDTISNNKIAMNNAIILYNVSCELSTLVDTYNLSNTTLFVDSIEGAPMIYILTLHSLDYQQIDSIAKNISNGPHCQIAEPSYAIFSPKEHSINPEQNALFGNQWQLFNASYPLYDVNAKDAWQYTTGENVIVAIIDNGFELQHPDLASNFIQGYDCTDGTDGATHGAYRENVDSHGTQCAGIIGAVNNDIGVVGIAPNCRLMPIRKGYSYYVKDKNGKNIDTLYHSKTEYVLKSFRQAYQNGADVISCSWSYDPSISGIYDLVLGETVSQGRNGLGCVIVFSVGNDSLSRINYPSNTFNVIAVGASNRYGYRAAFSNFGDSLDVVAPGKDVYTTQTIPYGSYCVSSGTSMACPMVAGITALILSQNPHLNWQEVRNIIRQTAYKLPYYNFDVITNNGTWNNQVGYGLVDGYAAMLEVNKKYIQNTTYSSNEVINELGTFIYVGDSVTHRKTYGNVKINKDADILLQATKEIRFTKGFHAKRGSNLVAKIIPESEWKNLKSVRRVPNRSNSQYQTKQSNESNNTDSTEETSAYNSIKNIENEIIISTSIYTISGQLIQTVTGGQHDATHLPNGMYILQHRMSDDSMRSEKIANVNYY